MAEYWKSTPSYWCKFCSIYVRDTGIERKNHEASAKHQNSIQRSLRELHKGKERDERDKQRAKDEVARLNGLVDGKGGASSSAARGPKIQGLTNVPAAKGPTLNAAQQRKAHAEQLLAMGVKLPEELEREVTGVGGWQTVSERVVEDDQAAGGLSLADIVKQEGESKDDVKDAAPGSSRRVHKRKAEDDEDDIRDEEAAPKQRKAWGSSFKTYPGAGGAEEEDVDLDALLSGVAAKKQSASDEVKKEESADDVKKEEGIEDDKPLSAVPDIDAPTAAQVKTEEGETEAVAPVVFKKRKGKK